MTDREKLRLRKFIADNMKWSPNTPYEFRKGYEFAQYELSTTFLQEQLDTINSRMQVRIEKYHPSGRPCFDKPAGVPIEHWETLCNK